LALSVLIALIAVAGGVLGVEAFVVAIPITFIVILTFYATHVEPFRLGVTEQSLTVAGWDAKAPPVKVLHIGDIHIERVTERERRLNALIEAIRPDIIVFSGDFVNLSYTHDETAKAAIRTIIGAWRAPLGVYAVPGTPIVEPLTRVLSFVEGLDMQLLANRWVTIPTAAGALHLLGMITTHDLAADRAALANKLKTTPDTPGLRLLLAHAPDIAPEAAESGQIDLYLCGHTHGGQIRLPIIGAPFSSSHLGNRFIMGRYAVRDMTLYTTRGVGMEGLGAPRARLLCPPEIVLWTLHGA
jgi:predicted MPP superfamily phosphohydrolase